MRPKGSGVVDLGPVSTMQGAMGREGARRARYGPGSVYDTVAKQLTWRQPGAWIAPAPPTPTLSATRTSCASDVTSIFAITRAR
jgi:hypothetical protein